MLLSPMLLSRMLQYSKYTAYIAAVFLGASSPRGYVLVCRNQKEEHGHSILMTEKTGQARRRRQVERLYDSTLARE